MKKLIKNLNSLIEGAVVLGLTEIDIKNAKEFLENREYGLCLDTLATQLYEYEMKINEQYYSLILECAREMHLKDEQYMYMRELVI